MKSKKLWREVESGSIIVQSHKWKAKCSALCFQSLHLMLLVIGLDHKCMHCTSYRSAVLLAKPSKVLSIGIVATTRHVCNMTLQLHKVHFQSHYIHCADEMFVYSYQPHDITVCLTK